MYSTIKYKYTIYILTFYGMCDKHIPSKCIQTAVIPVNNM